MTAHKCKACLDALLRLRSPSARVQPHLVLFFLEGEGAYPELDQCGAASGGVKGQGGSATDSGVTGLKALGVRELTYKLCFMACSAQVASMPVVLDVTCLSCFQP